MNKYDPRNSTRKSTIVYNYGKNPRRYLIGILYCVQFLLQGISANPLTPIAVTVSDAFNYDMEYVNYSSSVWFFSCVIFAFPGIFFINKYGLEFSIKYALFLFVLGFGVRLLIGYTIWSVLLGQFILGAAAPIIANVQMRVIAEWFDEKERGIWLTLSTLCQICGTMLGNLIPILFVDLGDTVPDKQNREQIWFILLGEAIAAFVIFVLTLIFFKKGSTRESIIRQKKYKMYKKQMLKEGLIPKKRSKNRGKNNTSFKLQLKHILHRPYLVIVILINGIVFGLIGGAGALLTPLISSVGYDEIFGGISNIVSIILGTASLFLYGSIFLRKRKQFVGLFWVLFFTSAFSVLSYYCYSVHVDPIYVVIVNGMVGFSVFPILTIVLEEMLSRLSPSYLVLISLILTFLHQVVTVISITVFSPVYADQDKDKSLKYLLWTQCIYVFMIGMYFVAVCFAKKDNARKSVMIRFKKKEDVVKGNTEGDEEAVEEVMNEKVDPDAKIDLSKGLDDITED